MSNSSCGRRNSIPRLVTVLIFLSITTVLHAQDKIAWESVDGADHYRIEFRQDGELVLDTQSEESHLPLFLPAGDYQFQVTVINVFGKEVSRSGWSPLKISTPAIPFIVDVTPTEIPKNTEKKFYSLVSGSVREPKNTSTFTLEHENGKRINLEIIDAENTEDKWVRFTLKSKTKTLDPGSWTLIMTNPGGQENRMQNALTIVENNRLELSPKIQKISPGTIVAGKDRNTMILKVLNMEEGAVVTVSGPEEIPVSLSHTNEKGILKYSLNLDSVKTGWYSVMVTNPSGSFDVKKKGFKVLPKPPTIKEIIVASSLKIDKKVPRPVSEKPHAVVGGWYMNFPLRLPVKIKYFNSYTGFRLSSSQEFRNDLFRRIPGFKRLSWDVTATFAHTPVVFPDLTKSPHSEIMLDLSSSYAIYLGLTYVTSFNAPVNVLLRFGLGMVLSILSSSDFSRAEMSKIISVDNTVSINAASFFGGGIQIDITPVWYVILSCNVTEFYYTNFLLWKIQPLVEAGWRW